MLSFGREFYKLTGSGNDFIFVDAREIPPGRLTEPEVISRMCARGTGIGADGVVFLMKSNCADFRIVYYNADGSEASMCGNAALCAARLGVELAISDPLGFSLEAGAGIIEASVSGDFPLIELPRVSDLTMQVAGIQPVTGESWIGFASVGVPHLVIKCDDVLAVDMNGRGHELRWHPAITGGANANFVSEKEGSWFIRTFERGVEAETLACGTGAAAAFAVLTEWGETVPEGGFGTASGCKLGITLKEDRARLTGEGRIVYKGVLGQV